MKVSLRLGNLKNYPREQLQAMEQYIGAGRRAVINERRPGIKRDESLLASVLLEDCLLEFGIAAPDAFEALPNGKPVLADRTISFSISHSSGLVTAAAGRIPLGVDVERIDERKTPEELLRIAERFFLPEEVRGLRNPALTVHEQAVSFFRIWTWKEAAAKCHDVPLPYAFKSFPYVHGSPYMIQTAGDDYVLTLASTEPVTTADVRLHGSFLPNSI